MCLSTVTEKYDKPSSLITDGWKTFRGTSLKPTFENLQLRGARDVPLDCWIRAEAKKIKASDGKEYETGFHVYEDEQQAKKSRTPRRVYVRRIRSKGTQDSISVVIAEEMYVPSDPDGWPTEQPSALDKLKGKLTGKGNA